jgi:hypothetical protein
VIQKSIIYVGCKLEMRQTLDRTVALILRHCFNQEAWNKQMTLPMRRTQITCRIVTAGHMNGCNSTQHHIHACMQRREQWNGTETNKQSKAKLCSAATLCELLTHASWLEAHAKTEFEFKSKSNLKPKSKPAWKKKWGFLAPMCSAIPTLINSQTTKITTGESSSKLLLMSMLRNVPTRCAHLIQ